MLHTVTHCTVTPGQVDAIFQLFDRDADGLLNRAEFCDMLEARSYRGLKEGKDVVGIKQWVDKFTACLQK